MLYRDPVIGGELLDDPLTAEAADAAVLLSTRGTVGTVVHTAAVDVRHPRLDPQGKPQATSLVGGEDSTRDPVGVSFATRNASASPRTLMMGAIGPKVSFFAMGRSLVTSTNTCGGSTNPCGSPPKYLSSARLPARLHQIQHVSQLTGINDRSDDRIRITRIPALKLLHVCHETLDKVVVHLRVHDDAVRTHADLTLVKKSTEHRHLHRRGDGQPSAILCCSALFRSGSRHHCG